MMTLGHLQKRWGNAMFPGDSRFDPFEFWWIIVAWGIFRNFPQNWPNISPKNPGWWKMIIHPMHGKVVCGSWAGRGRASATSDSSPTRCRGKSWVVFPLGHFRNHAESQYCFLKCLNHVIGYTDKHCWANIARDLEDLVRFFRFSQCVALCRFQITCNMIYWRLL